MAYTSGYAYNEWTGVTSTEYTISFRGDPDKNLNEYTEDKGIDTENSKVTLDAQNDVIRIQDLDDPNTETVIPLALIQADQQMKSYRSTEYNGAEFNEDAIKELFSRHDELSAMDLSGRGAQVGRDPGSDRNVVLRKELDTLRKRINYETELNDNFGAGYVSSSEVRFDIDESKISLRDWGRMSKLEKTLERTSSVNEQNRAIDIANEFYDNVSTGYNTPYEGSLKKAAKDTLELVGKVLSPGDAGAAGSKSAIDEFGLSELAGGSSPINKFGMRLPATKPTVESLNIVSPGTKETPGDFLIRAANGLSKQKDKKIVESLIGKNRTNADWCGMTCNAIMKKYNVPLTGNAKKNPSGAINYSTQGWPVMYDVEARDGTVWSGSMDKVERGNLIVFNKAASRFTKTSGENKKGDFKWGSGHVGWVIDIDDTGIIVAGGNQGGISDNTQREINVKKFSKATIKKYYPNGFKIIKVPNVPTKAIK